MYQPDGARSREALDDPDGHPHMLAFGILVDELVVVPAPTVAGDFVAGLRHRLGGLQVALQRHADGQHGDRDVPLPEQAHEAPKARAAAILEERFDIEVAQTSYGREWVTG